MKNNLPEDFLQVRPISSVMDCMNVASQPFSTDRLITYRLNLAKKFFKENLDQFEPEQIKEVFDNKFFKTNLDIKFAAKASQYCAKRKVIFPISLDAWFSGGMDSFQKHSYMKLLAQSSNREQIKLFINKEPEKSSYLVTQRDIKFSSEFVEEIQQYNPSLIIFNKSWNKERIYSFLKDKDELIINVGIKFIINTTMYKECSLYPPVVETLYELLTDVMMKNPNRWFLADRWKLVDTLKEKESTEKDSLLAHFLICMPNFWQKIEEKDPEFIRNNLNKKTTEFDGSFIISQIQYLAFNSKDTEPILQLNQKLDKYSSIILQPISEKIDLYRKSAHPFEVGLRHKKWNFFKPFIINQDRLNNEEQDMLVAASFMALKEKNLTHKDWPMIALSNCSSELFDKYYSEVNIEDPVLKNELYAIQLDKKLSPSINFAKKHKI